ncbi:MAG: hypothetical protein WAT16_10465 [Saprospiraceae bacterium]
MQQNTDIQVTNIDFPDERAKITPELANKLGTLGSFPTIIS